MWWCDFRGADLSRAKLKGVQFKDCVYNSKTKFPKGYTPKAGEWKKAAN
ncbi:MAG: pentapeptide repeat-containing protein [Fibrobacterales bacterium]|nr:pentapeptide repeat-containing protein [Fibrobacterales bacterium]